MNVLHPFVKVVLIVLTTLSGSVGGAVEHAQKDLIASDPAGSGSKAKLLPRRSTIEGASCVSILDRPEMMGTPGPSTGIVPEVSENSPIRLDLVSTQHNAFGAGCYALNALGYSAPAGHARC